MSDAEPDTIVLARKMIGTALKRLIHDYPFHARFAATWRIEQSRCVATAAVTVRDGRVHLIYAPAFVAQCTLAELEGVLAHEVNHVLFGHIFADPARFKNAYALMLAEEVTVNEWVSGPLPGSPITLAQFPDLPANEDTITRYERLALHGRHSPPRINQKVPKSRRAVPKTGGVVPKIARHLPKINDPAPKSDSLIRPVDLLPLDDHSLWNEARKQKQLNRMIVSLSAAEAREKVTPQEWQRIPEALRTQIGELSRGCLPGTNIQALSSGRASVSWAQLLRRYIGRALQPDFSFQRPPRRFPELLGIVPGRAFLASKAKVMAVIDTSGSISNANLGAISAELHRMSLCHEVIIVECDAAVHATYRYVKPISSVHGRGGTDLRPPFHLDVLGKIRPDLVVYFTDGCGLAPKSPPRMPVIWCLTPAGIVPAPWGQTIQMT